MLAFFISLFYADHAYHLLILGIPGLPQAGIPLFIFF